MYSGLYNIFLLRDIRTRDSLGDDGCTESRFERDSSCERKHFPTPPAPVCCINSGFQRGVAEIVPMMAM